jgi:UDP-N-acetylmuramate: L-alanyl-gamma-D-glutamyl-meso-diaminopimelate ligase
VSDPAPIRDLHHVHFVAIGGTGMGSLAGLIHARGVRVTGSDRALYPPMSTALQGWGIEVAEGFRAENVLDDPPDLVVIGNAVRADNVEARAAIDAGLPYRSFSDALYELAIAHKHCLTVSGTHGKTTTTSLCAYLLLATGRDPSLLVGGISLDFAGSFREGAGEHFVVEGDEYDTAFFDKTPKFLHYHPRTLVITSVEFDHADIYRDLDHVKSAFRQLVAGMPADGTLVAAWDHAGVRDVVAGAPCQVVRYGVAEGGGGGAARPGNERDLFAYGVEPDAEGTRFTLRVPGEGDRAVRIPMHGLFNVENALAALAATRALGVPLDESIPMLASFRGVKRRQEVRGVERGVTVVDDFAHHPTAVKGAVAALRARHPESCLVAVFEPRTNTSRRRIFQHDYVDALAGADHVVVFEVSDEPIYSATGEVTERFSAEELVAALAARGVSAVRFDTVEGIVEHLTRGGAVPMAAERESVVLVMSNGSFGNIWERLLEALRTA